uniref:Uncharacterized protein n=1 Tax=Musca domestica TaxID=7370 RepID=A0A1I8MH15_MUSDO
MAVKKLSPVTLADLVKRVPKDQMKQFEKFRDKTLEYHRRVNQYPEKLPLIDWEYYRNNVRKDYEKMVIEFQSEYEELDRTFSARHEINDFAKYYEELDKLTEVVKKEITEFFVVDREDLAEFIPRQGRPLFWPHNPEEQRVGPANPDYDKKPQKKGSTSEEAKPSDVIVS